MYFLLYRSTSITEHLRHTQKVSHPRIILLTLIITMMRKTVGKCPTFITIRKCIHLFQMYQ